MKNLILIVGLILTAKFAQAANQSYQCKTMGGPSRKAFVSFNTASAKLTVLKVKLVRSSGSDEDFEASFKINRVSSDGFMSAKGRFKGRTTGVFIPATIFSTNKPSEYGTLGFTISAGWDHRIEWGYGLHLSCKISKNSLL